MTKSQKYFQEMTESHKHLFEEFRIIHDAYSQNPDAAQEEFNTKGKKVQEVIRTYIDMLCSQSEGGRYGKFASNLEDTFMNQVRRHFPKIDFVGVEIE